MTALSAQVRRRAVIGVCLAWLVAFVGATLFAVLVSGCGGTTSRVTTAAACSSLMTAVAARTDYAPERAHADIDSVSEVCGRLQAVDGGTP